MSLDPETTEKIIHFWTGGMSEEDIAYRIDLSIDKVKETISDFDAYLKRLREKVRKYYPQEVIARLRYIIQVLREGNFE